MTTFTGVIAGTGIAASRLAFVQIMQARKIERIRHLLSLVNDFERDPMLAYRKGAGRKRLDREAYPSEGQELLNFFEMVAMLVRRKYLDPHDVWDCFSYWMFYVYADFRGEIEQIQRQDACYFRDFCKLIDRLRRIEEQEGGKDDRPWSEEIKEFWENETKAAEGQPIKKRSPATTREASRSRMNRI